MISSDVVAWLTVHCGTRDSAHGAPAPGTGFVFTQWLAFEGNLPTIIFDLGSLY